jgi:hypothetical protein
MLLPEELWMQEVGDTMKGCCCHCGLLDVVGFCYGADLCHICIKDVEGAKFYR